MRGLLSICGNGNAKKKSLITMLKRAIVQTRGIAPIPSFSAPIKENVIKHSLTQSCYSKR